MSIHSGKPAALFFRVAPRRAPLVGSGINPEMTEHKVRKFRA
jgi:hypothetical protein